MARLWLMQQHERETAVQLLQKRIDGGAALVTHPVLDEVCAEDALRLMPDEGVVAVDPAGRAQHRPA